MNKIPKLLIGDEFPMHPDEDAVQNLWVIRTREPFIMALVEPVALMGIKLHCHPAEVVDQTTSVKLAKSICRMADFYFSEVEQIEGSPESFDYIFKQGMTVPKWLMADNGQAQWSGIVHCHFPKFIATIPDCVDVDDEVFLRPDFWIDKPPMDAQFLAKLMREMGDFFNAYRLAEDDLEE